MSTDKNTTVFIHSNRCIKLHVRFVNFHRHLHEILSLKNREHHEKF